jgi:hypothetical protein
MIMRVFEVQVLGRVVTRHMLISVVAELKSSHLRRSVPKVERIALLVSDNSAATVAIFTAVTRWSFSEWHHSLGQQPPVFIGAFQALITKSAISHYF